MPQHVVEFGNVGRPPEPDGRLDAPAFHRNHEAIWSVLAGFLAGKTGDVLEAGSGTGQHVVAFARQTPGITWWPSDYNERHLDSIAAWRAHAGLANVRPPLRIDLADPAWGLADAEANLPSDLLAILCANVIHIAPWNVAEGLFAGAPPRLRPDGRLFLYGPFMRNSTHTAPSNEAFDHGLRSSNPEWGVRDMDDVRALAERVGLRLADIVAMPANNFILAFDCVRGA
jgi:SAM-dependent methyltransferase